MERKRLFIIIGFILLFLIFAFLIYWLTFRTIFVAPPVTAPAAPAAPSAGLPAAAPGQPTLPQAPTPVAPAAVPAETANGGLTKVSPTTLSSAFSPSLNSNGAVSFYNPNDGLFYYLKSDGTLGKLSDKTFYNVQKITWSPAGEKAILEYPDNSKILYNFDTKTQVTLPAHWQEFSFASTGSQIAFLSVGQEVNNRWLAISDADGSHTQAIEPLGDNADKVQVNWSPNNQVIAFSKTGEALGLDTQQILLVGKNHENFKALNVDGLGFQAKWTPDGQKIVYSITSAASDWKPELWLTDANVQNIGQNKTPLVVNTWIDKCAFGDNDTLYCGVPKDLPQGAGLYQTIADTLADNLYKIDLKTGASALLAVPSDNYTVDNLLLSQDQKILYFTDKSTGQLYEVKLK